jgi:hypothetical protein
MGSNAMTGLLVVRWRSGVAGGQVPEYPGDGGGSQYIGGSAEAAASMCFSESIVMRATPERAFAYLADPTTAPIIDPAVISYEPDAVDARGDDEPDPPARVRDPDDDGESHS